MSVQRGRLACREAGSPPRPGHPRAAAVPGRPRGAGGGGGGRRRVPAEPGRRGSSSCGRRRITWRSAGDERAARAILRLDADPDAIVARLGDDPLLGPSVRAAPGRRIPGHPDPAELAVRALLGQQISVAAARTLAGRLVAAAGEPLERPVGGITHRFPTPEALAALDPDALPMPRARARALVGMAGRAVRQAPAGDRAVDGRLRRAALRRRRRVPAHRPRREARARRARRRPGAGRGARRGVAPVPRLRGRPPVGGDLVVERRDAADLGLDRVPRAPLRHPPPQPATSAAASAAASSPRRRARCPRPPRPASAAARGGCSVITGSPQPRYS